MYSQYKSLMSQKSSQSGFRKFINNADTDEVSLLIKNSHEYSL